MSLFWRFFVLTVGLLRCFSCQDVTHIGFEKRLESLGHAKKSSKSTHDYTPCETEKPLSGMDRGVSIFFDASATKKDAAAASSPRLTKAHARTRAQRPERTLVVDLA